MAEVSTVTERRSSESAPRLAVLAAVLLATLALLVAGPTGVAAASVSANCAGTGGGAAFVADSNFTVYYNDSQPMPASGVFLNDSALEFRNVTLVANGTASLRLENATGTATCYADVNATGAPITVAPADGGATVVVDGEVDALSVGAAAVEDGNATLAYVAPAAWTVTVATGESSGTTLEATDADTGSTLDDGAVDGDGRLTLALPAGSGTVVLGAPPSSDDGSDPTETPSSGGGGGGGGVTTIVTLTPAATATPTATETATATRTPTATQTPTATATEAPTATDESGDEPPEEGSGGLGPLLALVALLAVLGAVVGAWMGYSG